MIEIQPRRMAGIGLLVFVVIGLTGCGGSAAVSRSSYENIRYGMTPANIESLLGKQADLKDFAASDFSVDKLREYEWEFLAHIHRFADVAEMRVWGTKERFIQVLFMDGGAVAKRQQGL